MTKQGGLKSFDEVFTDESVANILLNYYLPRGIKECLVYTYMMENNIGISGMYKRKKSNGRFSDFVINLFGFLSDSSFDNKQGQLNSDSSIDNNNKEELA